MGDKRRLQSEIDRCLKRVAEGVVEFEDIWQKVQNAANANQKEKFEADLKKEIKKLQRLRDQIKTWIQSNDVKDKRTLYETRKTIETHMERFKVMERDTKTKAYSKEGLGKEAKVDPRERDKEEVSDTLSDMVEQLELQVEQLEAEMELMRTKKRKDKNDKLEELTVLITKHRFYISRMELLKRMLENDSVEPDEIRNIEEDLKYYVESSKDEDFVENEDIFKDFDFDDTLGDIVPTAADSIIVQPLKEAEDDSLLSPSPRKNTSSVSTPTSKNVVCGSPNSSTSSSISLAKPTAVKPVATSLNFAPIPTPAASTVSSSSGQGFVPPAVNKLFSSVSTPAVAPAASVVPSSKPIPTAPPQPQAGYSAIAGSNIAPSQPPTAQQPTPPTTPLAEKSPSYTAAAAAAPTAPSDVTSLSANEERGKAESLSSLAASAVSQHNLHSAAGGPTSDVSMETLLSSVDKTSQSSALFGNSTDLSTAAASSTHPMTSSSVMPPAVTSSYLSGGGSFTESSLSSVQEPMPYASYSFSSNQDYYGGSSTTMPLSLVSNTDSYSGGTSGDKRPTPTSDISPGGGAGGLSPQDTLKDVSTAGDAAGGYFESVRRIEEHRTRTTIPPLLGVAPLGPVKLSKENVYQQNMLDSAFQHLPHASDSERLRPYLPRNPCPTPPYYPKEPLMNSDTVEFFERLATETLFFIFYYLEGTKAQYLAAKALKKQSWRFHTKYMMWFQRHEEPKTITDECEMGSYIYFDYEKWTQRRKDSFTFEYRFLEDRDLK